MNCKKAILVISFLAVFGFIFNFSAPDAKAMTTAELQAMIQQLQQQITQLQQQLAQVQGEPAVWCHDFNVNLGYGNSGTEVRALQTALEKEGFYKRTVSGYFDDYTSSAVSSFQEKYQTEVLAPWGLARGIGFVGTTTRAKLNALYGCTNEEKEVRPFIYDAKYDAKIVWISDQNPNTIFKALPLTKSFDNNSQSPFLIYDSNTESEIMDFLKLLTPTSQKVFLVETTTNTIPETFLSDIKNLGVDVIRQKPIDTYIRDFWTNTIGGPSYVIVSNQEKFMPYASVYAHRVKGVFMNNYSEVEFLVKNDSDVLKIIYFGTDSVLESQLSVLVSDYGKEFQLISTVAKAEISLTPENLSDTKNIVTVIHEKDNSNLDNNKQYWKLAPIYAALRQTMLITVSGSTVEEIDRSIDKELDNNIVPYNNNNEPDYLVIYGHWETIPYEFIENEDHMSADARYADRDEDGYYVQDIAYSRFTAYNIGMTALLTNRGAFFESGHLPRSERGIALSDWDNYNSRVVQKGLKAMFGEKNTYLKVDAILEEALNEMERPAQIIHLKGHGTLDAMSATKPMILGKDIVAKNFSYPAFWVFKGCVTGLYSTTVEYPLIKAALKSGAVNILTASAVSGRGSSWEKWYIPYLTEYHDIGTAYLKGQKDAEAYWSNPTRPKGAGPKSKQPQFYLIGDPLVKYGSPNTVYSRVPPIVSTEGVYDIQRNQATLKGELVDLGGTPTTKVWFEWGETVSYGNITSLETRALEGIFSITISNLSPGVTYHFRTVAQNDKGESYGNDETFPTLGEPFITLTSPKGKEKWVIGQTYDISWESSGIFKFLVRIYKDEKLFKTIGILSRKEGLQSYSWTIPTDLPVGNDYKIRVSDYYKPSTFDESDDYFSIASAPSITVTSPNGGEQWRMGQTYTITWSSSDIAKPKVDLYKAGKWQTIVTFFLTPRESYSWTIPTDLPVGNDYKIRVSDYYDSSTYDESDNCFSIASSFGLEAIENQLASISAAVSQLAERIKELMGR